MESLCMCFIDIDKGTKQGAGTLVLNLLLKDKTVMDKADNSQTMADDAKHDINYIFRDRK